MYLAWLSRATGIKAVVLAHTVYPTILLGLSYSAYYEIGAQLFEGEKKRHERGIFLLMVSVINLFFAGNVYTQSVFTLTRIWQGKGNRSRCRRCLRCRRCRDRRRRCRT